MSSHPIDDFSKARRRIVLMRHGAVDYFPAGLAPANADTACLSLTGRAQADAAGALFAEQGTRFDLVVTSGLARTVETAARALTAAGQTARLDVLPALREIRTGPLEDIPADRIEAAFTQAFAPGDDLEQRKFLGGETIGELLDRVLPAFELLLLRRDWDCMLLVLHGAVNRAILSRALLGRRGFLGSFEQAPACINVLDVGDDAVVVRTINVAPARWLHEGSRSTSMEALYAQFRSQQTTPPIPATG